MIWAADRRRVVQLHLKLSARLGLLAKHAARLMD